MAERVEFSQADRIVEVFGGRKALAEALGHKHGTTVQRWQETGWIPPKHNEAIIAAAKKLGLRLNIMDFCTVDPSQEGLSDVIDPCSCLLAIKEEDFSQNVPPK
ncbi:carph-isopro domain-containing protein [Roseibium sp. Sym1]|uniref:carph-isopro domain-containing protein n=1 Tax=Roseibium sp. Sym1 TaxID=3016006 RepID=UPI0022B31829|nr:hypothetical protein [Roseibium sp. Sym1]